MEAEVKTVALMAMPLALLLMAAGVTGWPVFFVLFGLVAAGLGWLQRRRLARGRAALNMAPAFFYPPERRMWLFDLWTLGGALLSALLSQAGS